MKTDNKSNLNDSIHFEDEHQTYGFRSEKAAPFIPELQEFEKKFWILIKNIKYINRTNEFQKKLQNDLDQLRKLDKIVIFADKSSKLYCANVEEYMQEVRNNVTSEYKRASIEKVQESNMKSANIARNLKLDDRMEGHTPSNCFITIKDHKEDFPSKVSVRLIAPSKSDIGKVSKIIIQKIIHQLNEKLKLNQWRDPHEVTKWFKGIEEKNNASFLKFDIVNFYPSISEELLDNALNFARSHVYFNDNDKNIIFAARRSFLYFQNEPWMKTKSEDFDVPMGSYDGAEVCEIIGIYLLHKITDEKNGVFDKGNVGLYRDDGLSIVRGSDVERERATKKLIKIFKNQKLKITTESGKTGTDYLNLYLDLKNNCYRQWKKPNNNPIYVNSQSSHPPKCLNQIPIMIEKMISKNSSSKVEFDKVKHEYQTSLKNSGYNHNLSYNPYTSKKKRKARHREEIFFNPPWGANVKTDIGSRFLKIVDDERERQKDSPMVYVFSRSVIKFSYGSTRNMKAHIAAHNIKLLNNKEKEDTFRGCNCRVKCDCPLDGQCQTKSVVYKATVTTNQPRFKRRTYTGMTEEFFKTRWNRHNFDIRHKESKGTTLSNYIHKIKDIKENLSSTMKENFKWNVSWEIIEKAPSYKPGDKHCKLCIAEKYHILNENENVSLNTRSELLSKCRHKAKFKLSKLLPKASKPNPNNLEK